MKTLVKKIILFAVPLYLLVLVVWIIDPLNYFGQNNIIPQEKKDSIFADSISDMMTFGAKKKVAVSQTDATCLVIGDSRCVPIDVAYWYEKKQQKAFNFALAGCYVRSATTSFFFALDRMQNQPNTVYWGHNFWGLSDRERFSDIDEIGSSPLKYVTSPLTWTLIKEIVFNIRTSKLEFKPSNENLNVTIQEGWNDIISRKQEQVTTMHIQVQPIIYELIDSISNYCKNHDIRLIHVYPPEYEDLLAIINSDSTTSAEYQKYLNHLSQYEFYNFNLGKWIENKEDFIDPMHPKEHVLRNIIDSIF